MIDSMISNITDSATNDLKIKKENIISSITRALHLIS